MNYQSDPHLTEYLELSIKLGLRNEDAAEMFDVNVSTIKRWKRGTSKVSKLVIAEMKRQLKAKRDTNG